MAAYRVTMSLLGIGNTVLMFNNIIEIVSQHAMSTDIGIGRDIYPSINATMYNTCRSQVLINAEW